MFALCMECPGAVRFEIRLWYRKSIWVMSDGLHVHRKTGKGATFERHTEGVVSLEHAWRDRQSYVLGDYL